MDQGVTVADSSSDVWDIAFGGTTLLANTAHGGGIQVIQTVYSEVDNALKQAMKSPMRHGTFIQVKHQICQNMLYFQIVMQVLSLKPRQETMLRWKYLAIMKGTQM